MGKIAELRNDSIKEEIVGCLWMIAALLAFENNYIVLGWAFAVKSFFDHLTSIVYAIRKQRLLKEQSHD